MIRRPRIKVAANLNVARRSSNKISDEINKNIEKSEVNSSSDEKTQASIENPIENVSLETKPIEKIVENDCAIEVEENTTKLNENSCKSCPEDANKNLIIQSSSNVDDNTFKTPMNLSRNEFETTQQTSSSNKYRKFKFAPTLTSSRTSLKSQAEKDEIKKTDDVQSIQEEAIIASQNSATPISLNSTNEHHQIKAQEHPSSVVINHNVSYPSLPQSPFPYHGRIRTESLSSMKSTREYTVANLHPRKMFREDQKLLDIKRESRERLSKKDVDKTKLRMFDMIYFNPQNNPMKPRPVIKTEKPKLDLKKEFSPTPEKEESSAMPVPRLKLNASGEMVLDESSLVIENEQQKQNRILLANNTVVYDDDFSEKYGIYKRQQRTKEWDQEETVKFYRCLNTVGTDFSMMLNLFPNRTRRDLKLKFKKEEKNNPHLVDKALLKHNVFDLDELQRDLDQEEAEKRKKMEESSKSEVKEHLKRKILKNQEAKLKAEERSRSKIEKILNDGDLAFKIAEENQLKENVDMKKKRKYTRKSKTEVISPTQNNDNGLQMFAGFPGISDSISTDKRRSRKRKNDELETTENVMITPKKTKLEKHPVTITNIVQFENVPNEIQGTSTLSNEYEIEVCDLPSENNIICFGDYPTKTIESFDKTPEKNHALVLEKPDSNFYYEIEGVRNEWDNIETNTNDFQILSFDESPIELPQPSTSSYQSPITQKSESPTKIKTKSKKKKFKPTLITRMKYNEDGEMVPELPEEEITENIIENDIIKEEISVKIDDEKPSEIEISELSNKQPVDDFDEEEFYRSLDFENLVVVEAEKDGISCYEIHKTDPLTQEPMDEPLNLPQKYVDILVKLMTNNEEDDEDV